MLLQRVITALVLLAVLLPTVLASSPWPFAALTLLMIGAAGWEWGRLNQAGDAGSIMLGSLVALIGGAAWSAGWLGAQPSAVWWVAMAVWVLGGSHALQRGPTGWPTLAPWVRWGLGVLVLSTAWLALAAAKTRGLNYLLSVFCVVWVADIAAYFGGRAFGRRKLAPAISPGKSWEGVWSGMLGVGVLAAVWVWAERHFGLIEPSLFSTLLARLQVPGLVLSLVFLASMSVVGDLFESLVKRAAGAKDSSRLLPGHGGVLDRVDALLPVFPIALALSSL